MSLSHTPDFAHAQQAIEICDRLCDTDEAQRFSDFLRDYTPQPDAVEWMPTHPQLQSITEDAYRVFVEASLYYNIALYFQLRKLLRQDLPYVESFTLANKLWKWQLPFLSSCDTPAST
jgi:hypothetical protein